MAAIFWLLVACGAALRATAGLAHPAHSAPSVGELPAGLTELLRLLPPELLTKKIRLNRNGGKLVEITAVTNSSRTTPPVAIILASELGDEDLLNEIIRKSAPTHDDIKFEDKSLQERAEKNEIADNKSFDDTGDIMLSHEVVDKSSRQRSDDSVEDDLSVNDEKVDNTPDGRDSSSSVEAVEGSKKMKNIEPHSSKTASLDINMSSELPVLARNEQRLRQAHGSDVGHMQETRHASEERAADEGHPQQVSEIKPMTRLDANELLRDANVEILKSVDGKPSDASRRIPSHTKAHRAFNLSFMFSK